LHFKVKQPLAKEIYESWYQVEKEIKKFDRIWNKVEKFDARHMSDPDNHERRQARLEERKKERNNHFIVYTGGLSEHEQNYRDYYESDLEEDPEHLYDDQ